MSIELNSKKVIMKSLQEVLVVDIKFKRFDNYFRFEYLVEYPNKTRLWKDESDIWKVKEDE